MSIFRQCNVCKFWKAPEDFDGFGAEVKLEANGPMSGFGLCTKAGFYGVADRPGEDGEPIPPMIVTDGEGYMAALYTAPTFGCNAGDRREE